VKEEKGDSNSSRVDDRRQPAGTTTSTGTVSFEDTSLGLVNTDWASSPPPPTFPVYLHAGSFVQEQPRERLQRDLGTRSPTLVEPLSGASWSTTGATRNDVAARRTASGRRRSGACVRLAGCAAVVLR
jgi:hypothetical protein